MPCKKSGDSPCGELWLIKKTSVAFSHEALLVWSQRNFSICIVSGNRYSWKKMKFMQRERINPP